MKIITSWGPRGYAQYGAKFLESTKYWGDITLIVYVDGMPDFTIPGVEVRHLENVEGYTKFREKYKERNGYEGESYNYRYDAIKFCSKVFAIHDAAHEESPFIWLDADTITTSELTAEWIGKWCKGDVTYLDRKGIDYAETGFIYFDGDKARLLIADLYDTYMSGEILNYREWTDAFAFSRLLYLHQLHGLQAHSLTDPDYVGLDAFENSPLKEKFIHLKGPVKKATILTRYDQLIALIHHYQPSTILETGTWNGDRALQMAEAAFLTKGHVTYHGYDLFEDASAATDSAEHNIKKHFSLDEVTQKLKEYQAEVEKRGKKFTFTLTKGNTRDTLKEVAGVDFAWLDGGHSHETILHDWTQCQRVPVVVFDDYYTADGEGRLPQDFMGVKEVFDAIPRAKKLYPSRDPVAGGGIVHIAVVGEAPPELPLSPLKPQGPLPIKVQAQDCMPKDHIINNVRENLKLISRWLTKAKPHNYKLIIASGGPDLKKRKAQIMKMWKEGAFIAAVKHALPTLSSWGIDADFLILLDPRDVTGVSTHGVVRTSLLEHIGNSTNVLIASMSDPSVTKEVMKYTNKVWGWHAMTQALLKAEVFPPDTMLINGGTCAAWRMLSLGQALGFQEFHLFGFDFCYPESEVDKEAKDEKGRPKFMQVAVGPKGKTFWTTGELLAASQDAQHFFTHARDLGVEIYCHGEGMGPTLWKIILGGKSQVMPTLKELLTQ